MSHFIVALPVPKVELAPGSDAKSVFIAAKGGPLRLDLDLETCTLQKRDDKAGRRPASLQPAESRPPLPRNLEICVTDQGPAVRIWNDDRSEHALVLGDTAWCHGSTSLALATFRRIDDKWVLAAWPTSSPERLRAVELLDNVRPYVDGDVGVAADTAGLLVVRLVDDDVVFTRLGRGGSWPSSNVVLVGGRAVTAAGKDLYIFDLEAFDAVTRVGGAEPVTFSRARAEVTEPGVEGSVLAQLTEYALVDCPELGRVRLPTRTSDELAAGDVVEVLGVESYLPGIIEVTAWRHASPKAPPPTGIGGFFRKVLGTAAPAPGADEPGPVHFSGDDEVRAPRPSPPVAAEVAEQPVVSADAMGWEKELSRRLDAAGVDVGTFFKDLIRAGHVEPVTRAWLERLGLLVELHDPIEDDEFCDPFVFGFANDGGGDVFGLYLYPPALKDGPPPIVRWSHDSSELDWLGTDGEAFLRHHLAELLDDDEEPLTVEMALQIASRFSLGEPEEMTLEPPAWFTPRARWADDLRSSEEVVALVESGALVEAEQALRAGLNRGQLGEHLGLYLEVLEGLGWDWAADRLRAAM